MRDGAFAALDLLPGHTEMLTASAISPEVAQARGYRTVEEKVDLKALGFSATQCRVPALLIPIRAVDGEIAFYQARPDDPRIGRGGKVIKYETPKGTRMVIDVPPTVRGPLADPSVPLVITEGARKVDAAASVGLCCIGLLGVWNWRGRNEHGGVAALADWDSIPLKAADGSRRMVYIAFDSDAMTKPQVHAALRRIKGFLESRGADVRIIYLPHGRQGEKLGLDDYLAGGRTTEELLALASGDLRPPVLAPDKASSEPPVIEVTADMAAVVDEAEAALLASGAVEVYQRTGTLVRVTRDRRGELKGLVWPRRAPLISPAPDANLRELLARAAVFMTYVRGELVQILPPTWIVQALTARDEWGFPFLEAVTESPTLRPDGSILDRPGYDAETGLLYAPNAVFPAIPESPTEQDVQAAVKTLLEPFAEFPFVDESDRAAALAIVLTLVGRHVIDGPCPMFAALAPTPGTGKGKLIQCAVLVATGRVPAVMAPNHDSEELRKVITTVAMEGQPAVVFDNAEGRFGSPVLAAALTAPDWLGRVLGYSRMITAPLHTVFFVTGNNLAFVGDTYRRVVPIVLDPEVERPEERTFTHPDLLRYVRERRPELYVAALTILRRHLLAGCPGHDQPRLGSYESWDDVVRAAVIAVLGHDPCAGRTRLREEDDEDVERLRGLLQAWRRAYPDEVAATARDAISRAEHDQQLRAALAPLDPKGDGSRLNVRAIGYALRGFKHRIVGGLRLERAGEARAGTLWRVVLVRRPSGHRGDDGDGGDGPLELEIERDVGETRAHAKVDRDDVRDVRQPGGDGGHGDDPLTVSAETLAERVPSGVDGRIHVRDHRHLRTETPRKAVGPGYWDLEPEELRACSGAGEAADTPLFDRPPDPVGDGQWSRGNS